MSTRKVSGTKSASSNQNEEDPSKKSSHETVIDMTQQEEQHKSPTASLQQSSTAVQKKRGCFSSMLFKMKHPIVAATSIVDTKSSVFRNLKIDGACERGHWNNKAEFMLSCIGLSVGLGNLWRFPTLAYNNGGAAFFIPYMILQFLIGKPMYFLELSLGQYAALGPTGVFNLNPTAKGVGISMVCIAFIIAIYYNAIMCYTLYFMFASMQKELPWTSCKPEWIKRNCYARVGTGKSMPLCGPNITDSCKCSGKIEYDFNLTACSIPTAGLSYESLLNVTEYSCTEMLRCTNKTLTPAHFYFYDEVIHMGGDFNNIGAPIWYLALCLLLSWIIVIICLMRGVKSSGKVVYFTATFPYVIIICLLIRGATLEGSMEGVKFFLIPTWSKLANIQVWMRAGGQMFFSLSVSFGAIITMGSYNKFRNNVYMDSLIIASMDVFTSFIAGLVVFTTLGAMAHDTGLDIKNVAASGYGLAFVAYPEALSTLPAAQFWAIVFFFMLFTLGIDSEFALLEAFLTTIVDEFPKLLKYKMYITIASGVFAYLVALTIITPGGSYILDLMDSYGVVYPTFLVCFCEIVAVMWVYGVNKILADMEYMLGFHPHPVWFWKATWVVIAPLLVAVILILSLVFYEPSRYIDGTPIHSWAQAVGWLLSTSIVLPIPTMCIWKVYHAEGTSLIEKFKNAKSPCDWHPQAH